MAARCASCSYPLSVSDSVSCSECLSYFHIDCAQLVGFPYYELSTDPIRNTFHCQTCKILPLPRQSVSFSDSDSDGECAMPSRQLDYHSDVQPDFAKDMNEIKGTVQDLSDLCKEMFKEINELKSINLTLRCCVENLRHDGEQRDGLISELTRRVEALEGKRFVNAVNSALTGDMYVEKVSLRNEEERYSTPDPEYSRLKELENLEQGIFQREDIPFKGETYSPTHPNFENRFIVNNDISEKRENSESAFTEAEAENSEDFYTHEDEEEQSQLNKETENVADEEAVSLTADIGNVDTNVDDSVKDWGWKGNNAIQIHEDGNSEDESNETSDVEDTEAQGWEILGEDMKSTRITKPEEEYTLESARIIEHTEESAEESSDEEEETSSEEEGNVETEVYIPKSSATFLSKSVKGVVESRSTFQAEETEEAKDEAAEGAERTSLTEEERVATPKPEGEVVVEIVEGEAEVEGRVESTGESRLEGEPGESAVVPEGELGEGGQSPDDQGEVQPAELSESTEPPPPPPPQHSPDDLWEYLKDAVTGEHPATVEEFVQKLIGTLEHVPEEYLKPVIDYNIKRAVSPSVTDGEHLEARDGEQHPEGVEQSESGEVPSQENGEVGLEGHSTPLAEDANPDGVLPEEHAVTHEDATYIPEDPSEEAPIPAEGYTALEATT